MNAPFSRSPEHLAAIAEVLQWCEARNGRASRLSRAIGRHSEFVSKVRSGANIWSDLNPREVRDAMRELEAEEANPRCKPQGEEWERVRPIPGRCDGRTLAGGEYRRQCMACARWLNGGSLPGAIRPRIVDGRCGQWRPE